ncbi:MAG: hypothetical protein ACI97B_003266 [Verrucomicrobiales bacterium]
MGEQLSFRTPSNQSGDFGYDHGLTDYAACYCSGKSIYDGCGAIEGRAGALHAGIALQMKSSIQV